MSQARMIGGFARPALGVAKLPSLSLLPDSDLSPVPMLVLNPVQDDFDYSVKGGVAGKVFFRNLAPNNRGLVVICHGNLGANAPKTPAYLSVLDYLGKQIASSGFVVISIKHSPTGAETAAQEMIDNVKHFMDHFGVQFSLTGKPLAIVGHSEAGRGALIAAEKVLNGAVAPHFESVKAVVAIAPSWTDGASTSGSTDALLVIAGTHDGDQNASGGRGLSYYPEPGKTMIKRRSLLWCFGFNHANYADVGNGAFDFGKWYLYDLQDSYSQVRPTTQRLIVQNYATMFLLWNLNGEQIYGKVFTGAGKVSWTNIDALMKSDIDKARMRVYPRFGTSSDGYFTNTPFFTGFYSDPYLKAPINAQNPALLAALATQHSTCKHQQSPGYVLAWDRGLVFKSPSVSVDCGQNLMSAGYTAIAFDAVQINNALLNNQGSIPVSIRVSLRNSAKIPLASASVVVNIEPSRMVYSKMIEGEEKQWLFRSVLSTIRVPLSSFKLAGNQWADFKNLFLDFSSSSYPRGRIALSGFRGTST